MSKSRRGFKVNFEFNVGYILALASMVLYVQALIYRNYWENGFSAEQEVSHSLNDAVTMYRITNTGSKLRVLAMEDVLRAMDKRDRVMGWEKRGTRETK